MTSNGTRQDGCDERYDAGSESAGDGLLRVIRVALAMSEDSLLSGSLLT